MTERLSVTKNAKQSITSRVAMVLEIAMYLTVVPRCVTLLITDII
jgi:hypothetical protein